eukprot:10967443-Alexandrium_andersonii.AAC.1
MQATDRHNRGWDADVTNMHSSSTGPLMGCRLRERVCTQCDTPQVHAHQDSTSRDRTIGRVE